MRFSSQSMVALYVRDVDMIPGTEIMATDAYMYSSNRGTGLSGPVPVPRPSIQPTDPLNWRPWIKYMIAVAQLVHVSVLTLPTFATIALSSSFKHDLNLNQQQSAWLNGIGFLTLALTNILFVPFSNIWGRRPITILCGVLTVGICIWEARITTYSQLLVARACGGLATATSETVAVQVIIDIYFLHQRTFWIGTYFAALVLGSSLGSMVSRCMAEQHDWRSFFLLCAGLATLTTLFLVYALPETKYNRNKHKRVSYSRQVSFDKLKALDASVEAREIYEVAGDRSWTDRGTPCTAQRWRIQSPDARWKSFILRDVAATGILFFNPIVLWSGLVLLGVANSTFLLLQTAYDILSPSPDSWTPTSVNCSCVALVLGALIGLITAAPLSDTVARRKTLQNGGIREAEMRLPALLPYIFLLAISLVIGKMGFDKNWPGLILLIAGFGLSGLCAVSIPTIAIAYAIDSYKSVSGEIMTVAVLCKNIYAFAMSLWIFDLAMHSGWLPVYAIHAAVAMTPAILTIPLYIWGKNVRRWTKDSILHRIETLI